MSDVEAMSQEQIVAELAGYRPGSGSDRNPSVHAAQGAALAEAR